MLAQKILFIGTEKGKIKDITTYVKDFVEKTKADFGILNVFVQHTTCSVFIQEPETMLKEDIRYMMEKMVEKPVYYHPENAQSHMKSSVLGQSVTIPITMGKLGLGAWQRILLYEFDRTTRRKVVLTISGEKLTDEERKAVEKKMSEEVKLP